MVRMRAELRGIVVAESTDKAQPTRMAHAERVRARNSTITVAWESKIHDFADLGQTITATGRYGGFVNLVHGDAGSSVLAGLGCRKLQSTIRAEGVA